VGYRQFKIIWSEPAKQDFEKIITQIAENAPINAARFGEKMLSAINLLHSRPKRFPTLYETPGCRYLLFRKYRVAFRIDEKRRVVYVLAILFPYQQFDFLRLGISVVRLTRRKKKGKRLKIIWVS
jgi:plasmid stabilization system protein ParE